MMWQLLGISWSHRHLSEPGDLEALNSPYYDHYNGLMGDDFILEAPAIFDPAS